MPICYRFRDITIYWSQISVFCPFLPTSVSFEALTRRFSWTYGMKFGFKKTKSPWALGYSLV